MSVIELQPVGRQLRSIVLHAVTGALAYKLVALFAPAVFITAGLKNGWRGFLGALAGSAAILTLFALLLPANLRIAELADALRLLLELGLPAAAAVAMVRRRMPAGVIVVAAVALSAAGFLLTELLMRAWSGFSLYATIVGELQLASADLFKAVKQNPAASLDSLGMLKTFTAAITAHFVPALLMSIWAVSFVASLLLVPRVAYELPGSEIYLFRRFAFPEWLLLLFLVGGMSPLLADPYRTIGFNLLAIVIYLYTLQGLAIYRSVLSRLPIGVFGLFAAFALLFLLMQAVLPIALLALAGLFDPFFDFRNMKRKEQTDESDSD